MRVVVLWQGLALATRGAIRDKQCILSTASFNKNRLNGTNPGLALYKETRRGVLENRLHQCNRETVRSAAATIPFVAFFQGQANTSILNRKKKEENVRNIKILAIEYLS